MMIETYFITAVGQGLEGAGWLTSVLLEFVRGGAEWVLWLLVLLSLLSVAAMVERFNFYRKNRVRAGEVREYLVDAVAGDSESIDKIKQMGESMQVNVVSYGLQNLSRGSRAVEELMAGSLAREKVRYNRYLTFLGTLGNNAPFIGLFGTVLGIINAFDSLRNLDAGNSTEAGSAVMGPIAEALIATGVGLVVAIPAVVAFNLFKTKVSAATSDTELLARTLLAFLHEQEK